MPIVVITCSENVNGKNVQYVSHGINIDTDENIVLPNERVDSPISSGWLKYDAQLGEYILK